MRGSSGWRNGTGYFTQLKSPHTRKMARVFRDIKSASHDARGGEQPVLALVVVHVYIQNEKFEVFMNHLHKDCFKVVE